MDDDSTAPHWAAWLQLRTLKLWQAIALSIGREPTEPLREAIFKGRVTDDRAPPHVVELLKRWHYCEQALSHDGPIEPQGYGMANPHVCPVLLADVAAFLVRAGYGVPEEIQVPAVVPAEPVPLTTAPAAAALTDVAAMPTKASQAAEKQAREDARLAHCEAKGLVFDEDPLRPLPYGIGKIAASLDPPIRRQSLSTDVKAALRRRFERARNGKG